MQLRSKQLIMGMISVMMIVSLFLSGCSNPDQEDKKDEQDQTETTAFKPLDTKSKKVAAEFEGGKITEGELNEYLNILAFLDFQVSMMLSSPEMKSQINEFKRILLKGFAAEILIAKEVKREEEFKKQATKELQSLEESLKNPQLQTGGKTPKNLDEAIKDKGFTKAGLEKFVVRSLQRNDYFAQQMKGQKYDHVKVHHVLVALADEEGKKKRTDQDAKKRADEVKKKLEAGGDWKKLAQEYSDDTGSKDSSGVVEGSADQFVPEFAKAVRTLAINKISDPVKTEYGYHVIRVVSRSQNELDKASEEIKQQKVQQLNQDYINKLKINILLPEAKKTK